MTVALPRMFGARVSILEANLAQTIGSASTSLATGAIFTLPALWLWLSPPGYLQIAGLALCGGVLGVSAMIPLRRLLIVRGGPDLPYPEGQACAEVLRATAEGDGSGRWIFGLGIGAAVKLALDLVAVAPSSVHWAVPHIPRGELALRGLPAMSAAFTAVLRGLGSDGGAAPGRSDRDVLGRIALGRERPLLGRAPERSGTARAARTRVMNPQVLRSPRNAEAPARVPQALARSVSCSPKLDLEFF